MAVYKKSDKAALSEYIHNIYLFILLLFYQKTNICIVWFYNKFPR